jgi:hypothetical protein
MQAANAIQEELSGVKREPDYTGVPIDKDPRYVRRKDAKPAAVVDKDAPIDNNIYQGTGQFVRHPGSSSDHTSTYVEPEPEEVIPDTFVYDPSRKHYTDPTTATNGEEIYLTRYYSYKPSKSQATRNIEPGNYTVSVEETGDGYKITYLVDESGNKQEVKRETVMGTDEDYNYNANDYGYTVNPIDVA